MLKWITKSRKRSRNRKRQLLPRPVVEQLETRILPATIVVTSVADTSADDGEVTLREAILAAETDTSVSGSVAGNGADTITFADGLTGTITLAEANANAFFVNALQIGTDVTIIGPGQDRLFIDGGRSSLLLIVDASADVSIEGVTFQNGRFNNASAGISNGGTLSLSGTRFRWNRSTFSSGGAIENSGDLTIDSSTFHNNFSEHSGSAIYNNSSGSLTVDRSSFFGNDSTLHTGAIESDGTLVVANSTFSQNRKGGIVVSDGTASIIGSTIVGNRLSGIQVGNTQVTLHNTAVALNFAISASGTVRSDIQLYSGATVDSSSSNNFVTYADAALGITDGTNGNRVGTPAAPLDPGLDGLKLTADQWTQAPLQGSPLIEAGNQAEANNSNGQAAAHDQTGLLARSFDTVDIGAVEFNPHVSINYVDSHHEVIVLGTAGDDAIVLRPGTTDRVAVNQSLFTFDSLIDPVFRIDAQNGVDQIRYQLGALGDTAVLRPGQANVYGRGFESFAEDVEFITVDGNGGSDQVTFYDSEGDDVFVHQSNKSYMHGDGFFNVANDFVGVIAESSAGDDSAQVFIDNVDANYTANVGKIRYRSDQGHLHVGLFTSFRNIDTWLSNVPTGRYTIFSAGTNVRFEARPDSASVIWPDAAGEIYSRHTVHNSRDNRARSSAFGGGAATAIFYDSPGDDQFVVTETSAEMKPLNGSEYFNQAIGFASYIGHSTSGNDVAMVSDTVGDDVLISEANSTVFTTDVHIVETYGFAQREFQSVNGGNDAAWLIDSEGGNHFVAEGTSASINNGDRSGDTPPTWSTSTRGFSKIVAAGIHGGVNTMDWNGSLGFTMIRIGGWSIN